jgi:translocator protein
MLTAGTGRPQGLPAQLLGLFAFSAICFAAAGIGALFTDPSVNGWYQQLRKPGWTPPDYVFGPVWSALYLAMAIAGWLVWRNRGLRGARIPLVAFGIQLALNVAWSALFFGLRSPAAAFFDIWLLWSAILVTIILFWPISHLAGLLLVPYLGWVSFAAVLNLAIWRLNQ